ncbi:hypothetical protein HH310_29165 [Actinoplanes sp. TBRC 11911]|uniref:OsmC family protein n=1 Tax=Actinoplanes sp. TBRC 11911 TaxID=2729386 RepID=UPI00145EF0CE|nr:OsmC family protein [Actinoplanes sp. TBRC 11911]NMO55242.1 hypothetical protein [Actinoplanes sp. TBRC 11911]
MISEGAVVRQDQDHVAAQARAFLPDTARRRTEITTRDYTFASDEPHLGKPGEGPTPTEYLLMALASCTAQTLRQYIDYKVDYAGDVTVEIKHHEGAEPYLERTIILSAEPDPDDLAVMHEIAEKSPVTLLVRFAFSVRTTFAPTR